VVEGEAGTVPLFGVPVRAERLDDAVASIDAVIRARRPTIHVVLNAGKVSKVASDEGFRELMNRFDMVHADGASVVLASRLLGRPLPERVAGIDLMLALVELAERRGYRPYFLGARREVVERCVAALRQKHPRLEVAGLRDGYWDESDPESVRAVVDAVRAAAPDLLFVAVPTPKKERFLAEHKQALGVPFMMGVGGAFDVVAGIVRRAPLAWQRLGMEWAYRLIQEPRRMWKRYLVTNTHFAWLLGREMVRTWILRNPSPGLRSVGR